MPENFYAVVLGFNAFKDTDRLPPLQYAERDAQKLAEVLTQPDYVNCPPENVQLITGAEVTQTEVEAQLYTHIVKERTRDDTVLVYYSGHGFLVNEKAYLATPKVYVPTIENNPNAGLRMDFLYTDIFLRTAAKTVIFILDCCYSGSLFPELGQKGECDISEKKLVEDEFFRREGRVAFVSCPRKGVSRESDELQHGVFTYHLLEGLKGKAAETFTNDITMTSLISYVQGVICKKHPLLPQPLQHGESARIVLAHRGGSVSGSSPIKLEATVNTKVSLAASTALRSPLEDHVKYIEDLVEHLSSVPQKPDASIGDQILESIQRWLGVSYCCVVQVDLEKNLRVGFKNDLSAQGGIEIEALTDVILPSLVGNKHDILPRRYGYHFPVPHSTTGERVLVVPLRIEYPRKFLILYGLPEKHLQVGELLGHTLLSIYNAIHDLTTLDIPKIECAIWDDLKRDYGRVPMSVYDKRFLRFKDYLKTVGFAYEPVVEFARTKLRIASWEALARDPQTKRAPYALFQAAELWGVEFTTELDLHCLRTAVESFIQLWETERSERKDNPDTLSVNLYPESLFREAYKKELERIIKTDELIWPSKLILEVSEKRPLPEPYKIDDEDIARSSATDRFLKQIDYVTKDLGVRLAIDDFGVGNSSISRLARLEFDYVKIDRDILRHAFPHVTVKYVCDLVPKGHHHPTITIIEGLDDDCNITLPDLLKLGIRHVQGHMIRRADFTVRDLQEDEKKKLQAHKSVIEK